MLALILSFFAGVSLPADSLDMEYSQYRSDSVKEIILQKEDSSANRYVKIDKVFIIGNKRTKDRIILRELDLKAGDIFSFADLERIIKNDEQKVFNTHLFNDVSINTLFLNDNLVDIVVQVSERWYIFPSPIFEIGGRNFNDWWVNQNRDLSFVNYGLKLFQRNLRGRNETMRLTAQFGFTQRFEIRYSIPYIDKAQRHGLSFLYNFSENKNVAYTTENHIQLFAESDNVLRVRRNALVTYTHRNSFFDFHSVDLGFRNNNIADTLAFLNPDYYLGGRTEQKYLYAGYRYTRDKRDIRFYPLEGFQYFARINKYGFGIFDDLDQFDITLGYARYLNLNKGFYLSNFSSGYVSGPDQQPYANFGSLGSGRNFVRGYELFLIEGQSFLLNKTSLRKRIFSGEKVLKKLSADQFKSIPFTFYLKTYFDFGVVQNFPDYENNRLLSNRYLFGTGVGIDMVTFYDLIFKLEYSVNREGNTGLFIGLKSDF
ncbi:MAG: POTRA domain-containing protein [Bacteroidota bacterium]